MRHGKMIEDSEEIYASWEFQEFNSLDEIKREFPEFLKRVKKIGYKSVIMQGSRFREIIKDVQSKLHDYDVDEVASIIVELSKMSFEIFDALLEDNEFALQEVESTPDLHVVFQCPELRIFHDVKIENGHYHHLMERWERSDRLEPDLKVILTKQSMFNLTIGKTNYTRELMNGNITVEGDMKKGIVLQQIFEIVKNGLDFNPKLI